MVKIVSEAHLNFQYGKIIYECFYYHKLKIHSRYYKNVSKPKYDIGTIERLIFNCKLSKCKLLNKKIEIYNYIKIDV